MLLFMDGQAHYGTAHLTRKYTQVISTTRTAWTVAAEGRFGNCIKRSPIDSGPFTYGYLDVAPLTTRTGAWAPTASGVCGFAIKIDDVSIQVPDEDGPVTSGSILSILDGGNFVLKVLLHPTGTFSLVQAWGPLDNYGFVIATSGAGIASGAWYYVECRWLIGGGGSFEIRVNTVPVLTYSGDTTSHNPAWVATGTWNTVRLLHLNTPNSDRCIVRLCDLYLADLDSADPDDVSDFLGDGTVETILPDGVGNSTGWTPSAAPNWDQVNDSPTPDDDSTYVATTDPDTLDTYSAQDIPAESEVLGIHVNVLARKVEAGSTTLAPIVRQGSTDYAGPTQAVADITYSRYLMQAWDLNPDTLAKFTAAEINGGEFGVKKVT
jgi:hypothetical protein